MKTHTTARGAASNLIAALARRAMACAPGGRVVSRYGIPVPGPSHTVRKAIVLAEALPTTAHPTGAA